MHGLPQVLLAVRKVPGAQLRHWLAAVLPVAHEEQLRWQHCEPRRARCREASQPVQAAAEPEHVAHDEWHAAARENQHPSIGWQRQSHSDDTASVLSGEVGSIGAGSALPHAHRYQQAGRKLRHGSERRT